MKNKNKIEYYMSLPYNYVIQPITDESGSYFYAQVLELEGCQSTGDTFEEAYNNLREAMEGWIELKLKSGYEVPIPKVLNQFSGKFVVRMPKQLHFKLSIEAEKAGVSLNQYVLYKLAK